MTCEVTVVPCGNHVKLIHHGGEVVDLTPGDVQNRSEHAAAILHRWMRDHVEAHNGKRSRQNG